MYSVFKKNLKCTRRFRKISYVQGFSEKISDVLGVSENLTCTVCFRKI